MNFLIKIPCRVHTMPSIKKRCNINLKFYFQLSRPFRCSLCSLVIPRIIANTRINPNLPTQAFITDFIELGGYNAFLANLCEMYKPRMEAINAVLNAHYPRAFTGATNGGFLRPLPLKIFQLKRSSLYRIRQGKWCGHSSCLGGRRP